VDKIKIEIAREELRKIRIQKEILWLKTLQEDVGNIIKKLEVMTDGPTTGNK
jgi:hypothetical protein